jgi:O-antigen biosynthesis protein WbqP
MINKILAFFLLFLFSPLFLLIILFIIIDDGTPFLYKQIRVGLNSDSFVIYKFRTMKLNTPELPTHMLLDSNKYLLRIGKYLRKFSLDELPNLINILKGEMVFIGPRPALHNQYDLIELRKKYGIDKLSPGITGWAQVNGRDELSIDDKCKFDKEYLDNRSVRFDLKILLLTFSKVILGSGVKH